MQAYRIFVEKKKPFQNQVYALQKQITIDLNLTLSNVRKMTVYDVFFATEEDLNHIKWQVFGESAQDEIFDQVNLNDNGSVAYAYLPGQYDMRADSAMQCIELITGKSEIKVISSTLLMFDPISKEQLSTLEKYLINPVEMGKKDLTLPPHLPVFQKRPSTFDIEGFIDWNQEVLFNYYKNCGFAMKFDDLEFIQTYFKGLKRNPTHTEIYVLDTYWSDHCRHTTFETVLDEITIDSSSDLEPIRQTLTQFFRLRKQVHQDKEKPVTLMDIATLYGKYMVKNGLAEDIEVSEEVNACSVKIDVEGETYLLMFKNETHNHPTEIEPYGGASTCIGGAIRDPLSGRAYVYQAARVTGAADILKPLSDTRKGKLPQSIISKKATEGFSAYGNQIGLATTLVKEVYHPGYEAKRLELGAVVGTVKLDHIQRKSPQPGDFIILIGGATGRDGIGGATGSSKSHDISSIDEATSEVQKGNAPTERKLQRLFMHKDVTQMIKKANDFGAGGVSVAIGELAPGVFIDLDKVPTKYDGLTATELAISESQERMAIVIDPKDFKRLCACVESENLTAHHVATVTKDEKLVMVKEGITVVEIERSFLNTNGIKQHAKAFINTPDMEDPSNRHYHDIDEMIAYAIASKQTASQKGMIEYFDATIGQTTVLMPFGGKTQTTENDASVQKLPIKHRQTDVTSILTFGFDPELTSWSPYHGAYLAVIESISKVVAVNGNYRNIRFSFQEYFQKLESDPLRWGKVTQCLLGALQAQMDVGMPAIGGKDSMSGTFEELHVPPTFVSFAVTTGKASTTVSPEFKKPGHFVYLFEPKKLTYKLPDINHLFKGYDFIKNLMNTHEIISAKAVLKGGWLESVLKMTLGNEVGFILNSDQSLDDGLNLNYGALVIESKVEINHPGFIQLGVLDSEPLVHLHRNTYAIKDLLHQHQSYYQKIYPITSNHSALQFQNHPSTNQRNIEVIQSDEPIVTIAVFPGTNCEYDSTYAFEDAGAKTLMCLIRNQHSEAINTSILELSRAIDQSHIFMIPGGFSAGDEPDGSGKFITAVLLNPIVKAAIERLQERKGLIIGICNGFQALIKSGLLPFGKLGEVDTQSPTLTLNAINRHISQMVYTKVIENGSPWYHLIEKDSVHRVPVSHGEGRFYAHEDTLKTMLENHQISTIYVDVNGEPAVIEPDNPNGSVYAIEGITSPDGRILGKMAHSERYGHHLYKNIDGNLKEDIFRSAIEAIKRGYSSCK